MLSLIVTSLLIELFVIFSYSMTFLAGKGTDYFEDVLLPFILFSIAAGVFFSQVKAAKKFKKLLSVVSIINLIILPYLIFVIFNKGYKYFLFNWWNFDIYKYRNLIGFLIIIIGFQFVKLLVLNIDKEIYSKVFKFSRLKKIFVGTVIVLAVAIVFVLVMQKLEVYKMEKEGNSIIIKVEEFKRIYGRLPNSRSDMGLPDSESIKPQYIKQNDTDYEIFYPIGFDDGYVYYSKTKKWGDYPPEQ